MFESIQMSQKLFDLQVQHIFCCKFEGSKMIL